MKDCEFFADTAQLNFGVVQSRLYDHLTVCFFVVSPVSKALSEIHWESTYSNKEVLQ